MRNVIAGTILAITALGATAALAKDGASEEQRARLEALWNKGTERPVATGSTTRAVERTQGTATKSVTGRSISDDTRFQHRSLRWQRDHRGQFGR